MLYICNAVLVSYINTDLLAVMGTALHSVKSLNLRLAQLHLTLV